MPFSPLFTYNQENLELMSAEKELITDEIHTVNDFYGQAHLLKKYANYNKPLKVVYEHSLPFHDIIWDVDKQSNFIVAFVSSENRKNVYKNQNAKPFVFNIGSILNYAIAIEKYKQKNRNSPSADNRTGSVYFPTHSTHHIKAGVNSKLIAEKLINLPEKYKPVYVCMYWKDIQNAEHKIYLENGLKVVSAGHIFDNDFYFRLYDILKNFKYALGSSFGSYIFHAARSGCTVIIPKELEIKNENFKVTTENFEDKELQSRTQKVNNFNIKVTELFSKTGDFNTKEQLEFIEYYCSSNTYSPLRIKLILSFADFVYLYYKILNKLKRLLKIKK